MNATRIIKIFLASSIDEFQVERAVLGDYIRSINPIFEFDNVRLEIIKCEDNHRGHAGRPQQEEIDEVLRNSDVSVFLFDTQAGEGTLHEFDVARKLQKTKHHEIIVFCHKLLKESRSKELNRFLRRLEIEKFYWRNYDSIEYIEKELTLGLLEYERAILGKPANTEALKETNAEKDADARFEAYQENENKQAQLKERQTQLREQIHQDIEALLQEIEDIKKNDDLTIAEKIFKITELYKKADFKANKTEYDKKKYSDLLFAYAGFLNKYGLYKDSEAIYLRQIPLIEELNGTQSKEAAKSYNNIGIVYKRQGKYDKALNYYFKALEIRKVVRGIEHKDTAKSYNNIGGVYYRQGDYDNALKYYFKALAIKEKALGKEHTFTATTYNNVGEVYRELGCYSKSLEYHFKALAIREKVLGSEHLNTASSYNDIGLVYKDQGEYSKALDYHFKALAIREKVLGKEHPDTAYSYNNIGAVFEKQGDYNKALEYYKKALAIREKVLGMEHPDTAQSYNNIGSLYYALGDYVKALDYLNKAYQIRLKVLGPEHPYTIQSQRNIEIVKKAM